MNSIVINPKALQLEMFHAFSAALFIDGHYIVTDDYDETHFEWKISERIKSEYGSGFEGKVVSHKILLTYRFSRGHVALRSTVLNDYTGYFWDEYRKMVDQFKLVKMMTEDTTAMKLKDYESGGIDVFELHSRILSKYLLDKYHPHAVILVTTTGAQLFEGLKSVSDLKVPEVQKEVKKQ